MKATKQWNDDVGITHGRKEKLLLWYNNDLKLLLQCFNDTTILQYCCCNYIIEEAGIARMKRKKGHPPHQEHKEQKMMMPL